MTLLQKLTEEAQDRQLVAIRVLNASRDLVFKAWTKAEYLSQWWGPLGFTNTFEIFEPFGNGEWKYVMHGPNGGHYANESRFIELNSSRIIIHHVSKPSFHLVVSFEDTADEKTRIIFRQVFETPGDCDKVKGFAVEANEQNLDRLEMVLGRMSGEKKLSMKRTFTIPIGQAFEAWINEAHLQKWWGPHGFTNPLCKTDPKPGGIFLVHMQSPDGMVFPTHGYFQKLVRPELLVFTTSAFEDDNGIDQLESLNTVHFKGTNDKTEISLQVLVLRSNPTVDEALDGMEEGWKQSFDKLEKFYKGIF